MKEYTINNENHRNLQSNVPFEELPEWFQNAKTRNAVIEYDKKKLVWEDGDWEDGDWKGGIWEDGLWYDGLWYDGTWEDGV